MRVRLLGFGLVDMVDEERSTLWLTRRDVEAALKMIGKRVALLSMGGG